MLNIKIIYKKSYLGIIFSIPTFAFGVENSLQNSNDSSVGQVKFTQESGPPPGFSDADLNVTQTNYISLYYGNTFLGNVMGTYDNDTINLGDLLAQVKQIPGILQPEVVAAALKGNIATNSDHLCSGANQSNQENTKPYCSVIAPEVAGVIFDPDNYRADIFLNPKYLSAEAVASTRPTIADSTAGFSYIANNSFTASATTETQTYSLNNISYFGEENNNLNIQSNLTQNNTQGQNGISTYTLQNAEITRLNNGLYYQVGMFSPISGGGFIGAPTVLGASVQNYGVLNSTAQGSPVPLFFALPSQVAVYKNGYLISTQSFNAGKQQLDTSSFPAGSYDLTLKITNNLNQTTTQTVFFVKQSSLPPSGSPNYQASLGVLQGNTNASGGSGIVIPSFVSVPVFTYTQIRKLGAAYGLQSSVMTSFNRAYLSELLNYYGVNWQLSPGALLSNNKQYGWLLNASFLPVNFPDLQIMSNNQQISNSQNTNSTGSDVTMSNFSPVSSASFQSTNSLNWTINPRTQLGLTESYQKSPGAGGVVQYGINMSRVLMQNELMALNLSGSVIKINGQDPTYSLQLSSTFNTVYDISVGVAAGYNNANTIQYANGGSYSVYKPNYSESVNKNFSWGPNGTSNLAANAQFDQTYMGNNNTLALNYISQYMAADLTYNNNKAITYTDMGGGALVSSSQTFNQISANFQDNIAVTGSGIAFGYLGGNNAGVMTSLKAPAPVNADVYINGQDVGQVSSGGSRGFFLNPYQTYQVTIQPQGAAEYGFDSRPKQEVLYAGNMADLQWVLTKQYVLFAQIVNSNNKPLSNMLMISNNPNDFNTTDDNGYIQANMPEDASSIEFKDINGNSCKVTINPKEISTQDQNDLVVLNTPLVCEPVKE